MLKLDPAAIDRLRADLAGYTVDAVTELLGPVAHGALGRERMVPAARVTSRLLAAHGADRPRSHRLAALVQLFLLARPVPRRTVAAALPALGVDGAVRLGLVEAAGAGLDDEVRARVDLRPYEAADGAGAASWWIVSDPGATATQGPLPTDHVLGVGGASLMLASSTIRASAGRVLDLGTGCGIQALHASRHADAITATDTSARALAFARFTWALNTGATGRARLDLRQGSLLEPVTGERFDLVVSNPPFVITPRRVGVPRYEYRDGGLDGDDVVRRLVTGMAGALAPGGIATMLGNWEHRRGQDWRDRLGDWLTGTGLDAWVVQREVQDPAEYAETWIRDGGLTDGPAFDRLLTAWLDDFESRDVDAVGLGLIVLRNRLDDVSEARSAGFGGPCGPLTPRTGARTPLRRFEDQGGPLVGPLGPHLAACLAAEDWLAATDDSALVAAHLAVAPDVTEERHHLPGHEDPSVVLLRQGGGFGRAVRASTALAGVVGACDGELPLGRIIGGVATLLGVGRAELAGELLPAVRRLVGDGLLRPPSADR